MGYLLDVFTGRPTGLYPFLAVLVFLLVRGSGHAGRRALAAAVRAAWSPRAVFGHAVLAVFFSWLTSPLGRQAWCASLSGVPLQVLLTALAGVLLWPLLKRIEPGERPEPGVLS